MATFPVRLLRGAAVRFDRYFGFDALGWPSVLLLPLKVIVILTLALAALSMIVIMSVLTLTLDPALPVLLFTGLRDAFRGNYNGAA